MSKSNFGFTAIEVMNVVAIIAIFAGIILEYFIAEHNRKLHYQSALIDLFNGQEVKVEGWMYTSNFTIDEFARDWCLNHSIPPARQENKIKELSVQFKQALDNVTIKLDPTSMLDPTEP